MLTRDFDELANWKTVYEAGHGLQEMARHQRKIKDDNKRLSLALENMTKSYQEAVQHNGLISHAFDKLKLEAGKQPKFAFALLSNTNLYF